MANSNSSFNQSLTIVLVLLAFLAGGLMGFLFPNLKSQSVKPETKVQMLTNESWKNQTVKGVLFTLEGEVADVVGNSLTVAKGEDKMTVQVGESTQIVRYAKASAEATQSGGTSNKEVIKVSELQKGDKVGLNVQGQSGGNLVALDVVVF